MNNPKMTFIGSMFDTIRIKHFYRRLACEDFKERWHHLSKKQNPTWVFNADNEKHLPRLTMIQTLNSLWHLSAEVSLPKMLFGHNARLATQAEVDDGMRLISEYVEANSGLDFDALTATANLIHYTHDVQLTESAVWKMINKLSEKRMKGLLKDFKEDTTLYFLSKGKSRELRVYPKLQEVLTDNNPPMEAITAANGVLRFEHCLLKPYAINAFLKRHSLLDKTAGTLLTSEVSAAAMSEVFNELNFYDLLTNDKTQLDLLLDYFPTKTAMTRYGFLETVKQRGEHFHRDETLHYSKLSYDRNVRDCRKAKAW